MLLVFLFLGGFLPAGVSVAGGFAEVFTNGVSRSAGLDGNSMRSFAEFACS